MQVCVTKRMCLTNMWMLNIMNELKAKPGLKFIEGKQFVRL